MPVFRCTVQYVLCALSSWGIVTVTAQAAPVPVSSFPTIGPLTGSSTVDADAEKGGQLAHPLTPELVAQAVDDVRLADDQTAQAGEWCWASGYTNHCYWYVGVSYTSPTGGNPIGHPHPGGGNLTGKSGPYCFAPLSTKNRANQTQVFENEGGVKTTGYQPSRTSGVTIGAGVDLSQWNTVQALESAGVSSTVANYLKTWMVSASQVPATVAAHGYPVLSNTDALNLSKDIYNTIYKELQDHFDRFPPGGPEGGLKHLPWGAQTALMDSAYVNGVYLPSSHAPANANTIWNDEYAGNWSAAQAALAAWGKTDTRYARDAQDMEKDLDYSRLPFDDTKGICQK